MKVIETFEITDRGLGIFLDQERFIAPSGNFLVEVTIPNGDKQIFTATKEYARKIPPGEIDVLFIKNISHANIPIGSSILVLKNENV